MRLFISHAAQDRARATQLAAALRAAGHAVFLDHEQLPPGQRYRPVLEQAVRAADGVIVLWTKNSIRSDWVREEAELGRRAGSLLPVRFGVEAPFGFREQQTPNLRLMASPAEVMAALRLGPPVPRATPPPPPPPPSRQASGERGLVDRFVHWATRPR